MDELWEAQKSLHHIALARIEHLRRLGHTFDIGPRDSGHHFIWLILPGEATVKSIGLHGVVFQLDGRARTYTLGRDAYDMGDEKFTNYVTLYNRSHRARLTL